MRKSSEAIFISGIDTDAGKTYATAFYMMMLKEAGFTVISQKFIQTGCDNFSEDIEAHRRLTGSGMLAEDKAGLTAPIIFSYPASAQLAARIDGKDIDLTLVERATAELLKVYDRVVIEGAGGLMVPITDDYFTIDYVSEHKLPVVLVTNGRLGSINHTILSLEAIAGRGIELRALIYNCHFDKDPIISADTKGFLQRYLRRHFPGAAYIEIPTIN